MLRLLTTDGFAQWFSALDDAAAEDVATALEVVRGLGPAEAAPGSRESLLWYEYPSVGWMREPGSIGWDLEHWGEFRDYARQILQAIEAPRFAARLLRLPPGQAAAVFESVERLKRMADPRHWTSKIRVSSLGPPAGTGPAPAEQAGSRSAHGRSELRRIYFQLLSAAGFELNDLPAHSLALRELSRPLPAPGFRLLYGVDAERERALFVLGEWLYRSYYGDSVRLAEGLWKRFLGGELHASEHAEP
jgi:hypothetical protein